MCIFSVYVFLQQSLYFNHMQQSLKDSGSCVGFINFVIHSFLSIVNALMKPHVDGSLVHMCVHINMCEYASACQKYVHSTRYV